MDLWASLEHVIRYKNSRCACEKKVEEVFGKLKDIIDEFDSEAMELRDSEAEAKAETKIEAKAKNEVTTKRKANPQKPDNSST